MKTPFTKMTLNGENMIIVPERLYNGMENEIHDLRETLSKISASIILYSASKLEYDDHGSWGAQPADERLNQILKWVGIQNKRDYR